MLHDEPLKHMLPEKHQPQSVDFDRIPGVDGVDWEEFGFDLDVNLSQITEALKDKRYKAGLVRRQYIPKPGGK